MERRLPIGIRWREVRRFEDGNVSPIPLAVNLSMACNHCIKPQCVAVCPENAYTKMPMGQVVHKYDLCIGCTKCVGACPYSAPVYNPATERTTKCDMCYDRVVKGLQPYCVQCCPNGALKMDTLENLVAAYGEKQDISDLGDSMVIPISDTNPSIVIKVR